MNNIQRLGNRGITAVISVVVVGVVIVLIGVVAFYVLRGGKVVAPDSRGPTQVETEPSDQELPEISNSDEVDVIEKELNQTSEGSFDSDFEALDEEASSL